MTVISESKHIGKALPNEETFLLLARDTTSPAVICEWIKLNIDIQPGDKLIEALKVAIAMSDQNPEIVQQRKDQEVKDRVFRTNVEV